MIAVPVRISTDVNLTVTTTATGTTANTVSDEGILIDSGYIRATNQGGGSTAISIEL